MKVRQIFEQAPRMASRWRRRSGCVLIVGERPLAAELRDISGSGARLDTLTPPDLGSIVILQHPEAGSIRAHVAGITSRGVQLSFDGDERSVAFALAAIVTDMTQAE
jgi:hypothetical protein